uniref:Uncharacterized protein n=1 Tax=Erpetoichthys calabaricus TaxID=27687 RepID=A0A8C4XFF6_ERPCA
MRLPTAKLLHDRQAAFSHVRLSINRSVMPLDVRYCTRTTLNGSTWVYPAPTGVGNPLNPIHDGDRGLQLFPMNEEFPVSAGHTLTLITSLSFVHTARRYYHGEWGQSGASLAPRRKWSSCTQSGLHKEHV